MTTTLKAAVIGDPIAQSLSPKMHNFWLKKHGINGSYEAKHVKSEELEKAIESMVDEGYAGFNVTIPHKETMFNLCKTKTAKASLTKAINTVTLNNGALCGDNSDCDGFLKNLQFFYPNFSIKDKNIFLIGAGGAARAILYATIESGAKNIFITNRSATKAQILIKDFTDFAEQKNSQLHFCNKEQFAQNLDKCDLLINSTSLGMTGQEELDLDLQQLNPSAIVYDIVYKPLITKLLQNAKNRGNKIVTGLGMLAFQGAVGFESWFGQKPEINEELLEMLKK